MHTCTLNTQNYRTERLLFVKDETEYYISPIINKDEPTRWVWLWFVNRTSTCTWQTIILNFDIISEIELLCKSPNVGTVSMLTVEVIIGKFYNAIL